MELQPSKANPHVSFFALTSHARTTPASSFPRSCSDGHYFHACVDICVCMCVLRMHECAVYVLQRVCGCAGLVCAFVRWNPTFQLLVCFALLLAAAAAVRTSKYHVVCIPPSLKLSSSIFGGHGATTVAHQLLPFVNGASVHARVCVLCFLLWGRTHSLKRGGRTLQRGQGDTNPHLLPQYFTSNRAATVATTAAVQQQYNSTSASNSALCDSHGAFVFYRCVQCSWDMFYTCNRS